VNGRGDRFRRLRAGVSSLLLLLWLSPVRGWAAAAEAGPPGPFAEIKRLYEDLDYEGALTRIQRARKGPLSAREEALLQLYEGIILSERSGMKQGGGAFESALRAWPTATLPVEVPPKIQAFFDETKQRVARELAAAPPPKGKDEALAETPAPKPILTPAPETLATPALTAEVKSDASPPLVKRWYFWAGVGAVAALAVGSIVLATSQPAATPTDVCGGLCDFVVNRPGLTSGPRF
jgi:hypothetical protein